MKCPECNNTIPENSNYCLHCGYSYNSTEISIANSKMHNKTKHIIIGCIAFAIIIFLVSVFNNDSKILKKTRKMLENDLDTSVSITEMYYNKEEQVCITVFESDVLSDISAVYLDTGKIQYYSDCEYYTSTSNHKKIVEYSQFAFWVYGFEAFGVDREIWKQIK